MRLMFRAFLLLLLGGLAWIAWQPPQLPVPSGKVVGSLPAPPAADSGSGPPAITSQAQWRVITRRIVWKQAVRTLRQRLRENGLTPIILHRREPVALHAFDDGRIFPDYQSAVKAKEQWKKRGIEADVVKTSVEVGKNIYLVSLGRFYLTEYAEQMQNRLRRIGKPYRYERRNVEIPAWRFTFPPMSKPEAERLWKRLQDLGVATPSLMPEEEFLKAYGKVLQEAATKSANRSNK